jgi:hypothetical protein
MDEGLRRTVDYLREATGERSRQRLSGVC